MHTSIACHLSPVACKEHVLYQMVTSIDYYYWLDL